MNQLPLDDLTASVSRIQGLLLTGEKVERAISMLAQAIKDCVPGTPGAGITLLDPGGLPASSGFTDQLVREADAAQYELGEGPCLAAWAGGRVVIVNDVRTDPRWPRWCEAVLPLPVRSVASAPLVADSEPMGTLKVYSARPAQYDEATGRTLLLFAGTAATLLNHIQGNEAPLKMTETLKAALASRDTVNLACGILMDRYGLARSEAIQRLITNARAARTSLADVSEHLITTVQPPER